MIFLIVLFGLCIGSFLNVVIHRLPKSESLAFPPSSCPVCKNRIRIYDNIPVIGYMLLRGKCRDCKSKISLRYPLIELLTGVIFGLVYMRTGLRIDLVYHLVMVSILISIFVIDLEHQIIPDRLNLILAVSGMIFMMTSATFSWQDSLYGSLAGGGILFLIALVGPMGGGDIKFMAAMGIWLGLFPTLFTLVISFLAGGLVGVCLILTGVKSRKDYIAFGPFLVVSALVNFFYFEEILLLYIRLFV